MVPLKEVEELEKEISLYSEITQIIQKIRDFIGKHKANFENKNLKELEESSIDLEKNKIKTEEKIIEINQELRKLDSKYGEIKNSIEKEKDTERDAEKKFLKFPVK